MYVFRFEAIFSSFYSERHGIGERKIKRETHAGNRLCKYSCDMSRCRGNPITSYSALTHFYFLTIYSFLEEVNDDSPQRM